MGIKDLFEKKYQETKWTETKKENIKVKKHGELLEVGCPQCKGIQVIPTGKTHNGHRVYQCIKCSSYVASPTNYAKCQKLGIIASDSFVNDCFICPIAKKEGINVRELVKQGKACPYFQGTLKVDKEEIDVMVGK